MYNIIKNALVVSESQSSMYLIDSDLFMLKCRCTQTINKKVILLRIRDSFNNHNNLITITNHENNSIINNLIYIHIIIILFLR